MTGARNIISAKGSNAVHLRSYSPGDEDSIIELFNIQNMGLGGFVPRTAEYWRWCCLQRPDVAAQGIQVAEKEGRLVGYIVVGNRGDVWEFCYDRRFGGETVASCLLEYALNYVRKLGNDSIVLNAYSDDQTVRKVCRRLGFAESPSEPVFLSVLDLPELILAILEARIRKEYKGEVFWFHLRNCPPWIADSFGIMLTKNGAVILEKPNHSSQVTLDVEMSSLVAIMLGNKSVFRELLSSRIRLGHFWNVFKAIRFLSLLKVKSKWSMPRADNG
jgi:hypothetical protein